MLDEKSHRHLPSIPLIVNVNGIECAVSVSAKVDSIISRSPSGHERRFRGGMVQLFLCTPWLHVWVSFH